MATLTDEQKKRKAEWMRLYRQRMKDNPEWMEKERKRNRLRYRNMTEEQRQKRREIHTVYCREWYGRLEGEAKERVLQRNAAYKREYYAYKKELGIPFVSDEERAKVNARNRERWATDPEYRAKRRKWQKAWRKKKRELEKNPYKYETEEEFYIRAERMKNEVRQILNY